MSTPLDLSELQEALANSDATWQMSENPITELTEDEREHLLGFTPAPGDMSFEDAVAADAAAPTITAGDIVAGDGIGAPAKFDNRSINGKDYTTPVKNQGGCGSCVGFATVAVMETTYQRRHNKPNSGIDLSEAHMFFCHGGSEGRTCANGWWPEKAFAKAIEHGVATEDKYPYTSAQQACGVQDGWQNSKATMTGQEKLATRAAMKDWIVKNGSITGCFIVYQDFFSYSSGVYRHTSGAQAGGHCVEIIGYDDSQAAWICKNSWGPNWGDNGYVRIGYGQCQIETWAGPYGAKGLGLRSWQNNKKVTGLWSNTSAKNAHVYLSGHGWAKIQNNNATTHQAMLIELAGAKAAGRNVNALVDNKKIHELYVV